MLGMGGDEHHQRRARQRGLAAQLVGQLQAAAAGPPALNDICSRGIINLSSAISTLEKLCCLFSINQILPRSDLTFKFITAFLVHNNSAFRILNQIKFVMHGRLASHLPKSSGYIADD